MNLENSRRFRVVGTVFLVAMGAAGAVGQAAPSETTALVSPLRTLDRSGDDIVTRLVFDPTAYRLLEPVEDVVLTDFVLRNDRRLDLSLRRIHVLTPDARIVEGTVNGDVALHRPDLQLFGGKVAGEADSQVFLSLSPHGNNGFIRIGEATFILAASPTADGEAVIYELSSLPPDAINWQDFDCQSEGLHVPGWDPDLYAPAGDTSVGRAAASRSVSLAIETDWEFTSRFGGNTEASSAYAITLVAAIAEIYIRDVDSDLRVDFLRVWSTSADPWDQSSTSAQLSQFRSYWNANMTHVDRHAAHFLSTRLLGGGVAYVGALCATGFDYGLSANLRGSFPYPLQDNHSQNWDVMVMAHELGHNFGAPHTHSMFPPVDNCAGGDCSVVPNGTIMSYCHTCPGGMSNILLEFHERTINEAILPFLENSATCDFSFPSPEPPGAPAAGAVRMNRYITFHPDPANDGVEIAYRVELNALELASCGGNGARCRLDHGDADCNMCSVSGEPCIGVVDCQTSGGSCDPTGEKCGNDQSGSVGMVWWVGQESPLGNGVALLVSEPFRRVSDVWPADVHVGDCEIVPRATYGVRAVEVATALASDEVVVQTSLRPGDNHWGDSVGPVGYRCDGDAFAAVCNPEANTCPGGLPCLETWSPPDGATNFDDVTAGVFAFQAVPGQAMPDRKWVDLHGDNTGTPGSAAYDPPNYVANFSDIQFTVLAFQGRPYPFSDPADCPDVPEWP